MLQLNKKEVNIIMCLISERIADMKRRQEMIDLNKFEEIILLGAKVEKYWFEIN